MVEREKSNRYLNQARGLGSTMIPPPTCRSGESGSTAPAGSSLSMLKSTLIEYQSTTRTTRRAHLRGGAPLLAVLSMLALGGAIPAIASAAELPEFSLLGHNGGTNITQMNMSTGEFSGSAIVDGEEFEVEGTETGNKSVSEFTYITDPSYVSTNTDYYEILPDGNVGGPGSFHDTNGTEESYVGEINEPTATIASNASVVCRPTDTTYTAYSCTATVAGNGSVPSGNVTFSASSGGFPTANQCALSAGTCSVSYTTPAGGLASPITINAVYSADATFRVSQGSTPICGSGGIAVTSATPESHDPDGVVPGEKVKLAGKGLCPGMSVQFGNEKAIASPESGAIATDGTSATVVVPRLATTGTLSVTSVGQKASLPEALTIDSFRNTAGLSFPNIPTYKTTVSEFEAAFGADNVTFVTGANPTDNLIPRAHEIFQYFSTTAFSGGLCFGWVFSALRFDSGELALASYDPDASLPWDLSQTPALESLIATEFWKQFSDKYQAARVARLSQPTSLSALEAALQPGLSDDGDPPAGIPLRLNWLASKNGQKVVLSHEVMAYATMTSAAALPGEPETLTIYVADPNVPFTAAEDATDGATHAQNVSSSTVNVQPTDDGGYTASFHGRQVFPEVDPLSVISGSLTPYAPPGVLTSWITPNTDLDELQDDAGKQLVVGDASEGIVPESTADEDAPATDSFSAPLADYRETLSGTGEIGDLLETSELTADVEASAGTDSVNFNPTTDTIGIEPPASATASREARVASDAHGPASRTAKLTLIAAQPNHSEQTVVVSGPSVNVVSLAHDDLSIVNTTGRSETVKITLGDNAGTPHEFLSPAVTIPAAGKLTAKPSWTKLAGSQSVEIVGRGRRAHRARLANRARPAAATITKLELSRGKGPRSVTIGLHLPALAAGSGVTVELHVMSGSHVVHTVTRRVTLPAKGGNVVLNVGLGPTPSRRARVKVLALTAASGAAIAVAQRERTIPLS